MTQGIGTFFCYAREDSDFALRLAKDLRDRGVEIWIDQLDIPAGTAWDRAIEKAIGSCGRMLIVLSPHSVASENVMDEVSFALDQGDRVVPILLEDCAVPLRIRRLQYIDFTASYEEGFSKLTQALSGPDSTLDVLPSSDPSPPAPPDPPTPAPRGRKKLLAGIAAVIALVALIGLATRSKPRTNRRQTSTAGSGMVAVPSVIGVAQKRAIATLTRLELEGTVIRTEETCSKPAGTVVRQDPAGMTQAKIGSPVQLVVAQRTPMPVPERVAGVTVLAPGASHATVGRAARRSRVEFLLAGDPCGAGTVVVAHPTAGREIYKLRAGEKGHRNAVYGAGKITIRFESHNRDARLVVRTD